MLRRDRKTDNRKVKGLQSAKCVKQIHFAVSPNLFCNGIKRQLLNEDIQEKTFWAYHNFSVS